QDSKSCDIVVLSPGISNRDCGRLIAETYSQSPCRLNQIGVFVDVVIITGGFFERYRTDLVIFEGYHLAKPAFQGELRGLNPEQAGEHAVVCRWRSATLHVPQYRFANLGQTPGRLELIGELIGDTAETFVFRPHFTYTYS